MDYNTFERCINVIKEVNALDEHIAEIFKVEGNVQYSNDTITVIIELLEEIFKDEEEWIRFWIYNLDFGNNYYTGCTCCQDEDGNCISLKSIHDLYNLITQNGEENANH